MPGASSASSYSSAGRSKAVLSPDLPSTSTMRTFRPARAAATARAAVTVVLPTPPLPATMTTRDEEQNARSSIGFTLRTMRRPPALRACLAFAAVAVAALVAVPAFGQETTVPPPSAPTPSTAAPKAGLPPAPVDVVQVTGPIDPVTADLVRTAVRRA